jgi:CO/xanthine dehydrogenase Mo-binding subunit
MTGFLHEKEFSRASFLKGGGAMLVGFSVLGAGVGAKAAKAAGDDPFASNGPYDQTAVDSWLIVHSDNTASLKVGKVEMGQGTTTALLIIAAEELNMDFKQMKIITHDTNVTPNQGASVGSQGVQTGGKQTRAAAATAYQALLKLASANLGVPVSGLSVKSGVVSGGGKTVTYGQLIGDKLFNTSIPNMSAPGNATTPVQAVAGSPGTKPVSQYAMVGKTGVAQRIDIPDKVTGKYTYVHNIKLPGMLHARLVRPRGQGAYGDGTNVPILSVDESSIKHIPDAQVVRSGNFLAVVAPKEYDAIQAAAQLKVKWADMPTIRPVGNLWKGMRDDDSAGKAPARIAGSSGNFDAAFASAAQTLVRSYKYHYTGHLPIGPSCCVADVTPNGARIFSNSQDLYTTRGLISDALKAVGKPLPANRIRLTYAEGSSVYGSAPYNDANQGAAILSALTGKPVRLQWMRWDEHGYDNYGPAQMTDIRAGIDSKGNITAFEFSALGIPYWTTPTAGQQVGIQPVFATVGPLDTTISGTQYNIPNWRLVGKSLPLQNTYFKVSFLRAPNAPQSNFAAEQAADELAYMAKMDPVAFRLQNIATPTSNAGQAGPDVAQRWRNVLTAVAKDSNWQPKVAASNLGKGNVVTGRGVAFGFYSNTMSCCVADITVNKKTGKIVAKNLWVAGDAGLIAYPEGSENNEQGAAVQGLSRAVTEEVTFNSKQVTSLDWVSYPMLRFKDAPNVFIHGLTRTDVPDPAGPGSRTTGSGEPALAPVAAAVANAFFDATGVRIYEAPMSPARVRAVLKAGGVK